MVKVYKNNENDYVCELWAASTKHPDSVFHMKDFKKVNFIEDKYQVFQWLLECASKMTFPFHAKELAEYAFKHWYNWN
jgi:hypothetical protein